MSKDKLIDLSEFHVWQVFLITADAAVADNLLRFHLVGHIALKIGAPLEEPRAGVAVGPPGNQRHVHGPTVDADRNGKKINHTGNKRERQGMRRNNMCKRQDKMDKEQDREKGKERGK